MSSSLGVTVKNLIGAVISNTASIGSLGNITFQVNPYRVKTFETLNRSSSAVFADHEVSGRKPASEMTGLALDEIDLHIVLNSSLGVVPSDESNNLQEIMANGEPQQLVIGTESLGLFTIRTIDEEWTHVSAFGNIILMAIDIHLVEYVTSVPTQAKQIMNRDEVSRSETGKGGPERLPGSAEATKKRTLTPNIDPVTRMEI